MISGTDKILEFTILYNRYKKQLYNFMLRLSGDAMTAEDIVQSVFIKLYESYADLRNKESANYWLFKTARNEYFNIYRKNKRLVEINDIISSEKDDEMELQDHIEMNDMKKMIIAELDRMNDDQKEVYLLKEYGGLSYKEISETLDITVDLVKSRLYKVRQRLIDKISKLV